MVVILEGVIIVNKLGVRRDLSGLAGISRLNAGVLGGPGVNGVESVDCGEVDGVDSGEALMERDNGKRLELLYELDRYCWKDSMDVDSLFERRNRLRGCMNDSSRLRRDRMDEV
jgi:hypothetical protein